MENRPAAGKAFNNNTPSFSIVEGLGVVVALIVLLLTLGSLRAAGMPLLTALLGVGITMVLIFGATGLDHRLLDHPAAGPDARPGRRHRLRPVHHLPAPRPAARRDGRRRSRSARAVATAGSAVVFAGLTVMIALVGLAVARIPFLTTMGVAAAIGVAIAVLIALTLLPALLGFGGERLRPKARTPQPRKRACDRLEPAALRQAQGAGRRAAALGPAGDQGAGADHRRWWSPAWGRWPTRPRTCGSPCPSNGMADPGTPARVTYDLISEHFGVGYNGPLIVVGHHRRLRRPARGDGRHRRRDPGAARRGQRAAGDAQRGRRAPASSR